MDTLPLFNKDNVETVVKHSKPSTNKLTMSQVDFKAQPTQSINKRMKQAKELLGSSFYKSVVPSTSKEKKLTPYVHALVHKFLPEKERKLASVISKTILSEAEKYDLDPLFLVALIQNESSFKTRQIGSVGEIGLMQLRPETAEWIAQKFKIKHSGREALFNPAHNIKIGTAFLSLLRKQFNNKGQLYVSAYNMGAQKVKNMVEEKKKPTIYMSAVLKRYLAFYDGLKKKGSVKVRLKEAVQKLKRSTSRKVANELLTQIETQNDVI